MSQKLGFSVFGRPVGLEHKDNGIFHEFEFLRNELYLDPELIQLEVGDSLYGHFRLVEERSNVPITVYILWRGAKSIELNRPGGQLGCAVAVSGNRLQPTVAISMLRKLMNAGVQALLDSEGRFLSGAKDWNLTLPNPEEQAREGATLFSVKENSTNWKSASINTNAELSWTMSLLDQGSMNAFSRWYLFLNQEWKGIPQGRLWEKKTTLQEIQGDLERKFESYKALLQERARKISIQEEGVQREKMQVEQKFKNASAKERRAEDAIKKAHDEIRKLRDKYQSLNDDIESKKEEINALERRQSKIENEPWRGMPLGFFVGFGALIVLLSAIPSFFIGKSQKPDKENPIVVKPNPRTPTQNNLLKTFQSFRWAELNSADEMSNHEKLTQLLEKEFANLQATNPEFCLECLKWSVNNHPVDTSKSLIGYTSKLNENLYERVLNNQQKDRLEKLIQAVDQNRLFASNKGGVNETITLTTPVNIEDLKVDLPPEIMSWAQELGIENEQIIVQLLLFFNPSLDDNEIQTILVPKHSN